jgi:hypothetical protein
MRVTKTNKDRQTDRSGRREEKDFQMQSKLTPKMERFAGRGRGLEGDMSW